jgi:putative heme-binding domain-containing protein
MPASWQLSEKELSAVGAYVRSLGAVGSEPLAGDPGRGARLYAGQGCAACHIIAGQGRGFGPELTSIGSRRSAAHLRESLTKPSAFVPEEFASVEAVTASGETIRGVRANEDSFTVFGKAI